MQAPAPDGRVRRATAQREPGHVYDFGGRPRKLQSIQESPGVQRSPGGTAEDVYEPFEANVAAVSREEAAAIMETAVAEAVFDAQADASVGGGSCARGVNEELLPLTAWATVPAPSKDRSKRLPGGFRTAEFEVTLAEGEMPSLALLSAVGKSLRGGKLSHIDRAATSKSTRQTTRATKHALRADSPDAPSHATR